MYGWRMDSYARPEPTGRGCLLARHSRHHPGLSHVLWQRSHQAIPGRSLIDHQALETRIRRNFSAALWRPYPADIAWIHAFFTFSTAVGTGSGILRLVPMPNGHWKTHAIFTNLENLHACFPELIQLTRPLTEQKPKHGTRPEERTRERECEDRIGSRLYLSLEVVTGQSGLVFNARLKYLGVKTLIIEREARIGELWRKRYEALCLHDTVCTPVLLGSLEQ